MGQIPGRALALALMLAVLLAALSQRGLPVATADTPPQPSNSLAGRGDVLTFTTRQAGVVTIPAADLAEAGWDVAQLDPARIHAWRAGRAVPLDVQVDAGGRLQALRLAVAPSDSRWSDEAVSWLSVEPTPGLRAPLPETRTGWTWDADELYIPSGATLRGDRWWSAQLNTDVPRSVALDLPAAAPAGTSLALALHPSGAGGALQVAVDGQLLGTPELASARPQTVTLALPQPLPPGRRMLTLTSHAPDPVLLDQAALPELVVPLPALSTPRLQRHTPASAAGAGDTLILTHASLRPALDPLIAAHQALGEQVQVVDVQTAYDLFSWGELSPEAIRAFIRLAAAQWSPAPQRVLLVGAGTVALRGAPPVGRETLIPPYLLVDTDPRGEVACDSCYGRTQTEDPRDQLVPDLLVGRLPARTLAEAELLVGKTVTALLRPPDGPWRARAVLLADNDREADGTPDPAGPFSATVDQLAAALPGHGVTRLIYAPDQPTSSAYDPDAARLRCRLFRLLDGGSVSDRACPPNPPAFAPGAALWVYVGHGNQWQWASTSLSAPVPHLVYLYDADARQNGDRLPILLTLTCVSGDWANPTLETIEERLLLRPGGGTAASLGSAGLGVIGAYGAFGTVVAAALGDGADLGTAHRAGIQATTVGGAHRDIAFAYSVLGDPSVRLPWVPRHQVLLPEVRR